MSDSEDTVKETEGKAIGRGGNELPFPGPGRPKGVPNKFTTLKRAFLDAFDELGGVKGLVDWAEKNAHTREQFYKMITKMLPSNVGLDDETRQMLWQFSDQFTPKIDEIEDKEKPAEDES